MMHYQFSVSHPASHFVNINLKLKVDGTKETLLKLPLWRPGRYELGNFAKNIRSFQVKKTNGESVSWRKKTKSTWLLNTENTDVVEISYQYYCNQLDAGACYSDNEQLYINPIHCCFYTDTNRSLPCTIEIISNFKHIATSLKKISENTFVSENFDELVDSPFIASDRLKHYQYQTGKITFHIWINGAFNPVESTLIADFKVFTEYQLAMMQHFPADEYHFMIQAVNHPFYHGVEHLKSTVLVIGPASKLQGRNLYNELIGVASHELFHVWNVKTIRPIEMLPYCYDAENYAETGYVYEGATTYYGDLILARCGYFSESEYFEELNIRINKHLSNEGRFNYSVAQSSFDTWLDGYTPGIPGRKTSIYDEGSLISFMLDFLIRKYSGNQSSLDNVFLKLYRDYGLKGIGYSAADYLAICSETAGKPLDDFFKHYVNSASCYKTLLEEVFNFAGLTLEEVPALKLTERIYGFKLLQEGTVSLIHQIASGSPAFLNGLAIGDELIAINGIKTIGNDFETTDDTFSDSIQVMVFRNGKMMPFNLKSSSKTFFPSYRIKHALSKTKEQETFFNLWIGGKKL
jgi:predicted metalloprotease with PDZ domain